MICVPAFALSSFPLGPSAGTHFCPRSRYTHTPSTSLSSPPSSLLPSMPTEQLTSPPRGLIPLIPWLMPPSPSPSPVPHLLAHVHDPLRSRDELVPLPASFERMLDAGRSRDILPSLSTTLFSLFQPHAFAWAQNRIFHVNPHRYRQHISRKSLHI